MEGSADIVLVDKSVDFADTADHWAGDAVDFAVAHGLFSGTSADTFTPDGTMTRGMITTVLHNFEKNPAQTVAETFTDVKADDWFADGVLWAAENGLASGYGDGEFGANDPITREQLATILYNYAKKFQGAEAVAGDLSKYTDGASVNGYANEAMAWAVGTGLIGGMPDGTLAPQAQATRAQVATVLMKLITNLTK